MVLSLHLASHGNWRPCQIQPDSPTSTVVFVRARSSEHAATGAPARKAARRVSWTSRVRRGDKAEKSEERGKRKEKRKDGAGCCVLGAEKNAIDRKGESVSTVLRSLYANVSLLLSTQHSAHSTQRFLLFPLVPRLSSLFSRLSPMAFSIGHRHA